MFWRKMITLFLITILVGCGRGDEHDKITFNEISREEMISQHGGVYGITVWYDWGDAVICNIYMMPEEEYPTTEFYLEVMGHEYYCHCVMQYTHPSDDPVCQ
jgi:hypothetical protein